MERPVFWVDREEDGFTLIELMVVVLIIGILIAIGVPTFLGARRRAQDRQAHSHLRNALVAQKAYYADSQDYTDDLDILKREEANQAWGNPDAGARGVVVENVSAVGGAEGQGFVLHSLSRSGVLFCIADLAHGFDYSGDGYLISTAGTWYGREDEPSSPLSCTGVAWEITSKGWD